MKNDVKSVLVQLAEQRLAALDAERASLVAFIKSTKDTKPDATVKPRKKRRTMSPEARAKIAAAQRARWAAQTAAAGQPSGKKTKKA